MNEVILNKLGAINYNLRQLIHSTDVLRTEINKMKNIGAGETEIMDNFYKSFLQFISTQEVKMYLMILKLNQINNNKEATIEREHRRDHPTRAKTIS